MLGHHLESVPESQSEHIVILNQNEKNKKESPVLMVLLILIETKSKSQSEHIVILNQNEKNKKESPVLMVLLVLIEIKN